nr:copia protein [Tanacetum cinerariifolium]
MTVIGTKWVFRNKLDKNGIVSRNKARLVAQGYNKKYGIDYDETYALVARLESIRILLTYACTLDFKLFQMDVKSALLNGFINEEKQPALAISTTEAEYVSAGKACQQALWMKQALIDYDVRLDEVSIMCDNKGAIDLSKNPGACVFTDKWSLNELTYGVPTDGPYQTNPPSPDDIISSIRIDREGQVHRICHEEEIDVLEYQILTREIVPTLKSLEETIRENVFCLGGTRDHVPSCLCYMFYYVVHSEKFNLAYYMAKRIKWVTKQKRLILPYGMLLTRLFKFVMNENPDLYKESYVLYDRVMNPLVAQLEQKTRKDRGTRRGLHSTSSSTFNQPSSSHLNDDDNDGNDEGTSRTKDITKGELIIQKEEMELESTQSNTTAKLPLLKQVAETTTNDVGTSTIKEKAKKKNDVQARSMLLMALPNEYLMTFNQYKDAKTLFATIETRFVGIKDTKKTQKTLLKQLQLAVLGVFHSQDDLNLKFLRSLPSEWNTHVVVWRNKSDLDTISLDDLYNNFKIVKQE